MVLNKSKKGAQGIGTLIIFIAMILVAAVAAGVLIQTASSLQSKALDVGTQSQERVTTTLDVVQVYGDDASDHALNQTTDKIVTVVRLGAGSAPIKLSDMKIKVDTKASSTILLNGATLNATHFTNTGGSYIETGDTVELELQLPATIAESESMTLTLMPKTGSPIPVAFTTPSVMVDKIVPLR